MKEMTCYERFAKKWLAKFSDPQIDCVELVNFSFAEDCLALGFIMDVGESFMNVYGRESGTLYGLQRIIKQVTDIDLLGSAIFSKWRYFNHWAYDDTEILEHDNLAWFTTAFQRMLFLSDTTCNRFVGTIQRVRLVVKNLKYGPCPPRDQEIEQHLTLNTKGRLWFSSYIFGDQFVSKYERNYSLNTKVNVDSANRILDTLAAYFCNDYMPEYATDIGDWYLEITTTDNRKYLFHNPIGEITTSSGIDLSKLIRTELNMDNLFAFDGNP